ncbi:MAG: HigA family addiction module antidote protein [Burkholderiales bacterium]|nr:HigA family addiction module antidote protein [Phycisphaerae bacterium]
MYAYVIIIRLAAQGRTMMNRRPTSPGEILREEFLKPLGLTQSALAAHIGCDVKVINRIVNERAGVTAEVALKLAAAFQTSPDFWLNAQHAVDLYRASKNVKKVPKSLMKGRTQGAKAA